MSTKTFVYLPERAPPADAAACTSIPPALSAPLERHAALLACSQSSKQQQPQQHQHPQHQHQQTQPLQGCGAVSVRASHNLLAGGTGCAEWEAGLALAEVLLSQPELVAGEGQRR